MSMGHSFHYGMAHWAFASYPFMLSERRASGWPSTNGWPLQTLLPSSSLPSLSGHYPLTIPQITYRLLPVYIYARVHPSKYAQHLVYDLFRNDEQPSKSYFSSPFTLLNIFRSYVLFEFLLRRARSFSPNNILSGETIWSNHFFIFRSSSNKICVHSSPFEASFNLPSK